MQEGRHLEQELKYAACQDSGGSRKDTPARRQDKNAGDHADREQQRRERGHHEHVACVQGAHEHRGRPGQCGVRHHEPEQPDGARHFLRFGKGDEDARDRRGGDHGDRDQRHGDGELQAERRPCQLDLRPRIAVAGQCRYQCGGEGALGQKAAQGVGDLEHDGEDVDGAAGSEHGGEHRRAHEAERPAGRGTGHEHGRRPLGPAGSGGPGGLTRTHGRSSALDRSRYLSRKPLLKAANPPAAIASRTDAISAAMKARLW